MRKAGGALSTMTIVTLATINPSPFANIAVSHLINDRHCSMLEMACRIFLRLVKPIFCLQKKGHDLITYCVKQKVPFTVFEDWSSILDTVKEIVAGQTTVQEAAQRGYEQYKKGEAGLNGHAT